MNVQQLFEYFQQLPTSTQIAVIVCVLVIIVGMAIFPAAGTSLITFLLGLKMLMSQ